MSESQPRLHPPYYDKFRESLQGLKEQHANYLADVQRSQLDSEAVAESVIHRFEICYDCLYKALRRHLIDKLDVSVSCSPGKIFRVADQHGLFRRPIDQWLTYVDRRIGTTHDYDCDKAQACLEVVPDFIEDAIDLDRTLSAGVCADRGTGQHGLTHDGLRVLRVGKGSLRC